MENGPYGWSKKIKHMKKHILYLLLLISTVTLLNAQEAVKISIKAFCSDSKNSPSKLTITISSNTLNLTEDAIQDNLGGYVDIPDDRYYLKTDNGVYRLNGVVENDYKNRIKKFTSYIYNDSKKFITVEEFYSLKNRENLKFIQKINLEENKRIKNFKTTTNSLNIYLDKSLLNQEYQKCK